MLRRGVPCRLFRRASKIDARGEEVLRWGCLSAGLEFALPVEVSQIDGRGRLRAVARSFIIQR